MSKKLNIAGVQNELAGGSAFFPSYTSRQEPVPPAAPRPAIPTPSTDAPVRPVRDGRPGRPVLPVRDQQKRYMRRHPFEIYDDQYQSLRDLALQERMQGGVGSMSAMVREALDAFIEKRQNRK